MNVNEWSEFLVNFNKKLLRVIPGNIGYIKGRNLEGDAQDIKNQEIIMLSAQEVLDAKRTWFGFPGASESQISDVEARLSVRLPESYRNFLKVSNGFLIPINFVPFLLPVHEINWFSVKNMDKVKLWQEAMADVDLDIPLKNLGRMIQITARSGTGADYFLLDPPMKCSGAWGVYRYEKEGLVEHKDFDGLMAESSEFMNYFLKNDARGPR